MNTYLVTLHGEDFTLNANDFSYARPGFILFQTNGSIVCSIPSYMVTKIEVLKDYDLQVVYGPRM